MLRIHSVHLQQILTEMWSNLLNVYLIISPGPPPAVERHDTVVEHMKEWKMAELFLHQKYDWVDHVNDLGEVKNPGQVESPESFSVLRIVDRLTPPAVAPANEKSTR